MAVCPECGSQLAEGVTEGLCSNCLIVEGFKLATTAPLDSAPASENTFRHFGDYDLLEEIARGGMGIIHRARQRSLDRIVAVKLLRFGSSPSLEYVKRFRAEASAAASLQHPNIVAIHEVGVHQGEHYLVMDLVDGPNLANFVKDEPLPARRAAGYLKTIAEAIHYAHEHGILHRDLKPSNVLIDANDQPRVTDFGLARRLNGDSSLTLTGQVLGSPGYMPPEQAGTTRHKFGRQSDVYSLGAMLYHTLVGRPPFVGEGLSQMLDQVFNREPVPPRLLNPAVPRDLETICLKCLEKEPARRYPTAQALADELSRFLRNEPIEARPVNTLERLWRWCRRKPALATLTVLLHLVAAGGLTGILWELRQARQNLYLAYVHLANEALEDQDLARTHLLLQTLDDFQVPRSKRGWEWRYLTGRSRGDQLRVLDMQPAAVTGIALSSNGQWLASINGANQVKLWDFTTGKEITNWLTHSQSPRGAQADEALAIIFSPQSHTLITSGSDRSVSLWDIPTARKLSEVKMRETVARLAFSNDGQMLAGGSFGPARLALWRFSDSSLLPVQDWESGLVLLTDLSFTPDGLTLFVGGPTAQSVRRYDISDPARPRRLPILVDSDGPLAVSPDGRWLATARADGRPFRVWALPTVTPVSTNYIRGSRLASLKFAPNSEALAAGLEDGRIILWDMNGTREPITLLGHEKYVMEMEFSPDGTTLVSASLDKTVRLWDLKSGERAKWSFPVAGSGHDVSFSPDSKRLVSVTQLTVSSVTNEERKCIVQLWDVDEPKGLVPRAAITNTATSLNFHVSFSRDGTTIAADTYNWLWFLQAPDLTLLKQVPGARLAYWGPKDRWLSYVIHDRLVRSNTPSEPTKTLDTNDFMAWALSPDGSTLATACKHSTSPIELRNADDGHLLGPPLGGHEGWVTSLAFSPDGKTLASAGWDDGWLKIWDVHSRRLRARLRSNNGSVYKLDFSPDGISLATCGSDETVRLWNVARLQEVAVLQGHRGPVNSVAFSPDRRWLASASSDGTIRLWFAPSFEEIAAREKPSEVAEPGNSSWNH